MVEWNAKLTRQCCCNKLIFFRKLRHAIVAIVLPPSVRVSSPSRAGDEEDDIGGWGSGDLARDEEDNELMSR